MTQAPAWPPLRSRDGTQSEDESDRPRHARFPRDPRSFAAGDEMLVAVCKAGTPCADTRAAACQRRDSAPPHEGSGAKDR